MACQARHWISWLLQVFNPEANHTLSTLTVSVDTKSSGMAKVLPCIAGKSAQQVGTILPLSYLPLCLWPSKYQYCFSSVPKCKLPSFIRINCPAAGPGFRSFVAQNNISSKCHLLCIPRVMACWWELTSLHTVYG